MKQDAFSGYHPAVNFMFFLGVLIFGMTILHPAYLLIGLLGAVSYYLLLHGRRGLKSMAQMIPLFLAVMLINPLFNTQGTKVLFSVFGRPYTLEALTYGAVLAGMFLTMILWFSCYSLVMTGDKFTSLFGNLAPALSLLLVMIFRLVPGFIRKGRQIFGARASIGKGSKDQMAEAGAVFGGLTSWALEGSVVTADSMRSRGYGAARRTSFMIYRMTGRDRWLLGLISFFEIGVIVAMATGATSAAFTPQWEVASIFAPALALYALFVFLPTILYVQEALLWHISKSRI